MDDEDNLHIGQGNIRRRVRGPTFMPKIWAQRQGDRISVSFNEYGQPIDEETTSQLTHFMGSLARSGKYCPVHKPWLKVDKAKKQNLLKTLKVRNWRARIKKKYYDPSLSLPEQINSKPKRVQRKQWKRLVKSWNKEDSKRVSEKHKENRAKKKMVQLTGKKSYARVREQLKRSSPGCEPSCMDILRACFSKNGTTKNEEAANAIEDMEELKSLLPEGATDEPGPNDIFSKVMGEDQNGPARMFGMGVRPSDVWGVIPSRSACHRENLQLKSTCDKLSGEVTRLTSIVQKQGSNENDCNGSEFPFTSPLHPSVANQIPPLRVGVSVYLKSILNPTENVAKGRIKSLDPSGLVGGKEIGPNWCEVNVQVPIKRNECLVRPYGLFDTIEDAIGATVAWPCPFISVVHEDDA